MLKQFLYWVVGILSRCHGWIMALNDRYAFRFSDKTLHFLVIGLVGMGIFFLVHPIFVALVRRKHEIVISWIYTFTVILVITFAIEIGQKVTGTGNMEFADIVFGVVGFLLMFLVFALIRWIVGAIRKRLRKQKSGKSSPENQ